MPTGPTIILRLTKIKHGAAIWCTEFIFRMSRQEIRIKMNHKNDGTISSRPDVVDIFQRCILCVAGGWAHSHMHFVYETRAKVAANRRVFVTFGFGVRMHVWDGIFFVYSIHTRIVFIVHKICYESRDNNKTKRTMTTFLHPFYSLTSHCARSPMCARSLTYLTLHRC